MTDETSFQNVPVLRRLWLVVLLTCLIIPFPLAMILLLSGPVYRWRETGWQPIGNGARYTYGGLLTLWLVAVVGKAILVPNTITQDWAKSANPEQTATAAPANTAPTSGQASEVPAGGGVKADNYEDAPAATAMGGPTMPSDQREYVSARESLWEKQRAAGEGTRTYTEVGEQFDALNASMDGKEVRDWICIIPNGEGGKVRDNMRTLSCTADGDNRSRYNLFFDDPTVLQEATYPGDVLTVSGVIENKSGGWIRVHPSTATVVEKSK